MEFIHTPVFEKWFIQAPVLHLAVVNIISRREEGEVTHLKEGMILFGEEARFRNTFRDWVPILQPCDIDHRRKDVVHKTDEGVGLTWCHRRLGKHSHLRNLCGEEAALIGIANSSALPPRGNLPPTIPHLMVEEFLFTFCLGMLYIHCLYFICGPFSLWACLLK